MSNIDSILENIMKPVEHGRANHDPLSKGPMCLCGAAGVKDPMWDRYYCPDDGIWLEGCWAQCWCKECLIKIKEEWELLNKHGMTTEEHDCLTNPINEW